MNRESSYCPSCGVQLKASEIKMNRHGFSCPKCSRLIRVTPVYFYSVTGIAVVLGLLSAYQQGFKGPLLVVFGLVFGLLFQIVIEVIGKHIYPPTIEAAWSDIETLDIGGNHKPH